MFQVPILLILWRRPKLFEKQLSILRKVKPRYLYIAVDGEREGEDYKEESKLIKQTKELIKEIDWDVQLFTLIREKNLGCGLAVSSAIDWFFENNEEGIIIEDDVIPEFGFFNFMESQLNKWRKNDRVFSIGASCLNKNVSDINLNFIYKSPFFRVWGWATYKNRWKFYKYSYNDKDLLLKVINNLKLTSKVKEEWIEKADWVVNKLDQINTWDYQWQFTIWLNNGYCISPNFWAIKNEGFGEFGLGTHTVHETPRMVELLSKKRLSSNMVYDLTPIQGLIIGFLNRFCSKCYKKDYVE
jgi:hypothetical protein